MHEGEQQESVEATAEVFHKLAKIPKEEEAKNATN
jgi:hypothetical protein